MEVKGRKSIFPQSNLKIEAVRKIQAENLKILKDSIVEKQKNAEMQRSHYLNSRKWEGSSIPA